MMLLMQIMWLLWMSVVDNADDEQDDFGTADAMLQVEYKYQMLHLTLCKLPTI